MHISVELLETTVHTLKEIAKVQGKALEDVLQHLLKEAIEEYHWKSQNGNTEDSITTTGHPYIIKDKNKLQDEPIIKGTKTPVRAIVEMWRLGESPEEIPTHLPHITQAQVFDALSYYSDYQTEINGFIEKNRVPQELVHPAIQRQKK